MTRIAPTGQTLRREPVVRPARVSATYSGPAEPAPCFVFLQSATIALLAEGVAVALLFAIVVAWMAIGRATG